MKRCNEPATIYAVYSGFRVCADHNALTGETGTLTIAKPCDQVVETKEQFWSRHPNSRMFNKLGLSTND